MKTTLLQKSLLWAGASVAALTAASFAPAVAQTNSTLEIITVTTTRREENIQDVANSVTAASGEDLAPFTEAGGDILTLAARVPSLYAESSNGRVAPRFYIRGLGNTDFDLAASQPVSVIMDEIVQENVILKSFPLFDIEQVEIARGPQGTLFGRNTTAGTISFRSARPTAETEGYVSATVGSLETVNVEAALGGTIVEDVLTGRMSVMTQNRGDYIDNAFLGIDNAMGGFREWAGRVQLHYTPTDNFDALFNVHARSLAGTSAIFRANILTAGSNSLNGNFDRDTVFFDSVYNNPQAYDGWGTSANLNWRFDNGMSLTSISGYESANGRSLGDIDGGNMVTGPGFIPFPSQTQDSLDFLDQYTQEFRLASADDLDTTWQVGAYFFDSSFAVTTSDPDGIFPPTTTVRHGNELWSVFAQASHQATERLELSGGIRFTNDEKDLVVRQSVLPNAPVEVSDEQISWDLSAYYDYREDLALYARVARGFRGPTIQARDVAFFNPPSTADSETNLSWEVGFKAQPMDGRARINGALFYYTVEDLQLSAVGGSGNLVQLVNADEGVGYGLEIDSEFLVNDNFVLTAGFSWNETELQDDSLLVGVCAQCTVTDPTVVVSGATRARVDGNPFPQAPDYTLSFTARYAFPVANGDEWFVYTDWFYQGRTNLFIYESEEFYSDGNFEGGLRVGYAGTTDGGRPYEAAFFVRNITDEENLVGGIDFNNNTGFVNEPRVFGLSVRASLN